MHRDTRLAELIGEAVVMRSTDPETGGEIIRQVAAQLSVTSIPLGPADGRSSLVQQLTHLRLSA